MRLIPDDEQLKKGTYVICEGRGSFKVIDSDYSNKDYETLQIRWLDRKNMVFTFRNKFRGYKLYEDEYKNKLTNL